MVGKILKYFYVLATCTCFAQEANDICDDEIIHQIAANQDTCVIGCAEEKIYLNPNRIYPTDQGLYLSLNDVDYVLLPSLNSDHNGCYIRPLCNRMGPFLNTCPSCGLKYYLTCNNPNCSLYQRNEERKREKERQKEEDRERKRQEKEKKKEEKRKNKK